MSPEEEYRQWRKRREIGCFFARAIANHPDRFGQRIECIPTQMAPSALAGEIGRRVDAMIADPAATAAALVFPMITTLEGTARAFLALEDQAGWAVEKTVLPDSPSGDMVAVRITKIIPFGQGSCPSEALVLGPFEVFPQTRRAPIVVFELYVGEPRPFDPKDRIIPTTKANLAHIEMNLPTHQAFERIWNRSVDGRAQSLGRPDTRAKAKVSFVLPDALAVKIGCLP